MHERLLCGKALIGVEAQQTLQEIAQRQRVVRRDGDVLAAGKQYGGRLREERLYNNVRQICQRIGLQMQIFEIQCFFFG